METSRKKSFQYSALLTLCKLFHVQRVMELPPKKSHQLFRTLTYKGVVIPKMQDEKIAIRREEVQG
nr:alpha/beta hydrolase [Lachnospiraceae bacterium]